MILFTSTRYAAPSLIGLCATMIAASFTPVMADDGQPVAIRHWKGNAFTVETMWGFQVGLGVDESNLTDLPRKPDLNLSDIEPGKHKTLERLPNEAKLSVLKEDAANVHEIAKNDGNALVMFRSENEKPTWVHVDGLKIVYLNDMPAAVFEKHLENTLDTPAFVNHGFEELVVIATGDQYTEKEVQMIAGTYKPRLLVVNSKIKQVGDVAVEAITHNTVAVSHVERDKPRTRIVSLGTQPYEMSEELADLFANKEAACEKSRSVFAKLSVDQMNFKPANGTHTPRWNTEHMMGRELGFFSKIYHAIDPEVPCHEPEPCSDA